jgi:DnaJ-class molecular chaperone
MIRFSNQPRFATCPTCEGLGEIDTGRIETDTGAPVLEYCTTCNTSGGISTVLFREITGHWPEEQKVATS